MPIFARSIVAIASGAFILCDETCLHIGDIIAPSAWTDLPMNDWFLLRSSSTEAWRFGAVCWLTRSRFGRNRAPRTPQFSGFQRALDGDSVSTTERERSGNGPYDCRRSATR